MTTYRKKKGSDPSYAWHWCTNCTNWPTSDYDEVTLPEGKRPTGGELCDQCLGKEDKRDCDK